MAAAHDDHPPPPARIRGGAAALRAVVRRLSQRAAPRHPPPHTPPAADPPSAAALVRIDAHSRQPDHQRSAKVAVARSAFDDVPPPQFYDPAWNTAPLRAEAGRLGHGSDGPVLPPAFTLRSSDLDDSDDDDSDGAHSTLSLQRSSLSPPSHLCFTPDSALAAAHFDSHSQLPPSSSSKNHPPAPSPNAAASAANPPPPRPSLLPSVFDSPLCAKLTAADIRLLVEHDYHGEVIVERPTDIRARVHATLDNASTACTVVFSLHQHNDFCRVSIRRTFADSFRITNHLFDSFCSEFAARFLQLRHVPQ